MTTELEHEDAVIIRRILADSALLRGIGYWFDPDEGGDGGENAPFIDRDVTPKPDLLKGLIWWACVSTVDKLFADLHLMATGGDDAEDMQILCQLPPAYADLYTPTFIQDFLVATVDTTRKLAVGWAPLATIAEELALRILFNEVQYLGELWSLKLGSHWRSALEDVLFEDLDHESLYGGLFQMHPRYWFTPFNPERGTSPFPRDQADETIWHGETASVDRTLSSEESG